MIRARTTMVLRVVAALAAALGILSFDIGSAASVDTARTVGNQVIAADVPGPSDVLASLAIDGLITPSCRADISWTAPPGATTFEVRRRSTSGGSVEDGPWQVTGTTFTDAPLPLQLVDSVSEWQVRTVADGWPSDWVTATTQNTTLCLL